MLFKTSLFMVKVSASDGLGRSRILVISVLFKTCALLGCYQWFAYEPILSLCHSVSTSLLPCNIYLLLYSLMHVAGSADLDE